MRDGSYFEFWVYILTSRNGTLYVGVTGYLHSRIMQHKIDSIESFTKNPKSTVLFILSPNISPVVLRSSRI
jgi:predicted GIY-YIG superfamily endonuclease